MKLPEPVAWVVRNGVVNYQLIGSKSAAVALAAEKQKQHDLSGSWASFGVYPLFTESQLRECLEKQKAVMRQALDALEGCVTRPTLIDDFALSASVGAIKALQEALK